jgi:hypothetical protein
MVSLPETLFDLQDGHHHSCSTASLNIFPSTASRAIFFASWQQNRRSASSNSLLDPQRSYLLFKQLASSAWPKLFVDAATQPAEYQHPPPHFSLSALHPFTTCACL